jgi:chromosome segregation ATPase
LQDNATDTARAQQLAQDAAEAAARLNSRSRRRSTRPPRMKPRSPRKRRAPVMPANADLEECETELAQVTGAVAEGEAQLSALNRRINDFTHRLEQLQRRREDAEASCCGCAKRSPTTPGSRPPARRSPPPRRSSKPTRRR